MALPIVAIPVVVSAQAAESSANSLMPSGAVLGLRSLWYREDGRRMKVTEPVLWFKSPIGEQWDIAASRTIDMVSGASPILVENTSGKPVQVYTGASITDRRKANDVSVTRKYGALNENSLGVSYATSDEKDYGSKAIGVNATFDFNERNTTLALGAGRRNDRVRSVIDATLNAPRDANELLLGITQLIDRGTLLQSNLAYTKLSGYLNDPYKQTFSVYRDGGSPRIAFVRDLRPDTRSEIAWLTRGKRALPAMGAIISAEYRYYRDDWGIRAHTLAGSWLQTVNETWQIEAGLRYYSQTQADFYRAEISQRPVPRFTSSDQRIAAFGSIEPSLKVIVKLTDQLTWDLGYARYLQRASWKLNGGGSADYEPLSAKLINSALTYKF